MGGLLGFRQIHRRRWAPAHILIPIHLSDQRRRFGRTPLEPSFALGLLI